jgi:hypothetical protein
MTASTRGASSTPSTATAPPALTATGAATGEKHGPELAHRASPFETEQRMVFAATTLPLSGRPRWSQVTRP